MSQMSKKSTSPKTAIVTGANSGIGKETARHLLQHGYHVIMVCRNPQKAEDARAELEHGISNEPMYDSGRVQGRANEVVEVTEVAEAAERAEKATVLETTAEETTASKSRIEIEICDLSDMSSIRELATRLRARLTSVDRLINNAGILSPARRELTREGFEKTFATNHLAYFLLTRELMPLLKAAPEVRIINVASDAHRYGRFEPTNLQLERGYNTSKAYGNSKLFNIMFTHELAKRLSDNGSGNGSGSGSGNRPGNGSNITTYSLHPGVVNTNFAAGNNSLFGRLFNLGRFFMLSPEKGARTTNYLATEPNMERWNGRYFSNEKLSKATPIATNDDACKTLWEQSETFLRT